MRSFGTALFCLFLIANLKSSNQQKSYMENSLRGLATTESSSSESTEGHERKKEMLSRAEHIDGNYKAYSDDLTGEGIWLPWHSELTTLPSNAVSGGYDRFGPMFVARFNTTENSQMTGQYYPDAKRAVYAFQSRVVEDMFFDILLHESFIWAKDPKHPGTPILGGSSLKICRYKINNNLDLINGYTEDDKWCTVATNTSVVRANSFEVLRRSCNNQP